MKKPAAINRFGVDTNNLRLGGKYAFLTPAEDAPKCIGIERVGVLKYINGSGLAVFVSNRRGYEVSAANIIGEAIK